MGQIVKQHKIIPISWACTMFLLANLTLALVGVNMEKCDIQFVTQTLAHPYL